MSTVLRYLQTGTFVIYKTNYYGGNCADLDNTTPVNKLDGYSSIIDLTEDIYATLKFRFKPSGATDNVVVKLYKDDDGIFDGSEVAIDTQTVVSGASTEKEYTYTLNANNGPGYYRFSMQSSGGTNTFDMIARCTRYKYIAE